MSSREQGSDEALRDGHFAKKQIYCSDRLIAWSHSSRFEIALDVVRELAPESILDHGCGDGTFLAMLMSADNRPKRAVGTEISDDLVSDCGRRLGHIGGTEFIRSEALDDDIRESAYDVVICMEVLEHAVDLEKEISRLERVLSPGGWLIVSVPVEIGVSLIVKHIYRRIAGWRGIGDYPGDLPYTFVEFVKSVFAGAHQHVVRPIISDNEFVYHTHKGFNWKVLHQRLEEQFQIYKVFGSPIRWLPPYLNSQAWLVARKPL